MDPLTRRALSLLAAALLAGTAVAQDEKPSPEAPDVAGVPVVERRAGDDVSKRYFLIGLDAAKETPRDGYGLVLIMPGGGGGADFHPFCRRIWKHALGKDYVAAQLVAVKWTDEQRIVWPTKRMHVTGMEFSTEEFLAAVIEDVEAQVEIDRSKIFTLSWSSSGPAAYAAALDAKSRITGSFVAMSVFMPDQLPSLRRARGHGFFLLHSEEDQVCPMRMAEEAEAKLRRARAQVELVRYEGGHGWRGNVWGNMRKGFAWLEDHHGKPVRAPRPKRRDR